MNLFLQVIVNGIIIGAVYALSSIGYALAFSVNINNFAHGSIMILGAFVAYLIINICGFTFIPTLLIIILVGLVTGILIFYFFIKIFEKKRNWIILIVSTLALGIIIENAIILFYGTDFFSVRQVLGNPIILKFFGFTFTDIQLFLVAASLLILFLITFVLKKTKLGLQFRAVAEDTEAAQAMGISITSTILLVVIFECTLAMLAGFLISLDYDQSATSGTLHLLNAYTATIIGGARNLSKIIIAAYFIGLLESLTAVYISTEYMHAAVFVVLIAFLLIKKEGLEIATLAREV